MNTYYIVKDGKNRIFRDDDSSLAAYDGYIANNYDEFLTTLTYGEVLKNAHKIWCTGAR